METTKTAKKLFVFSSGPGFGPLIVAIFDQHQLADAVKFLDTGFGCFELRECAWTSGRLPHMNDTTKFTPHVV
jgi:hypothetical protein